MNPSTLTELRYVLNIFHMPWWLLADNPILWSSEDHLWNKAIPPNFGSKTATTFCHVYCGRLGQRNQSTPWPLTLINPGLECCIQGVAICVPCCVKASLLPHSLSSLPVFRSSQVIRRGLLKPRDDRMTHYYHLKLEMYVCLGSDEMQLSTFTKKLYNRPLMIIFKQTVFVYFHFILF